MRFVSHTHLLLAAVMLSLGAACSDKTTAVAEVQSEPSPSEDMEAVDASTKTPDTVDVDTFAFHELPEADTPSPEPRTLLEEEAMFHEDAERDHLAEGDALVAAGKPGEAIESFRRALYSKDEASVWSRLGSSYIAAGDAERGARCLEEAIDQNPGMMAARESLVTAYLDEGDAPSAQVHAEYVARANPGDGGAQHQLGKVYMKLSMWNEAIESFEKTIDIQPGSSFAHNNLGYSALQVGRDDVAVEHLEIAIDLEPVKPFMFNNLGVAYERTDRGADAMAAYLRAEEMKPGYVNAVVNKERIAKMLTDDEVELAMEILDELKAVPTPTDAVATAEPTFEEVMD
jgi:Flp pilus assembly protein TadD